MIVAQIKGSNGSGKTTIVKQMLVKSQNVHLAPLSAGWLTVMQDLGWIAIGKYSEDKVMGGCDAVSTIKGIKELIFCAVAHSIRQCGGTFNVVFEGMMISTIKSTFYKHLLDLMYGYGGIDPKFVILSATPEGCIARIQARGTMKSNLNHDNIRNKCDMVIRHARTYDQRYVRWIDVESTPLDQMLAEFLDAVGDTELLDELYPYG